MIYLNHAATSFPKPEKVVQAVTEALQCPPAGQYRSVFDSRGREGDVTSCLRKRMGEILGVLNPERIFCYPVPEYDDPGTGIIPESGLGQ